MYKVESINICNMKAKKRNIKYNTIYLGIFNICRKFCSHKSNVLDMFRNEDERNLNGFFKIISTKTLHTERNIQTEADIIDCHLIILYKRIYICLLF